jgi:hypothetical protein
VRRGGHGQVLDGLRGDPDRPWFVWGHAERVWWELTAAGTRLPIPPRTPPVLATPTRGVLAKVDAALSRYARN